MAQTDTLSRWPLWKLCALGFASYGRPVTAGDRTSSLGHVGISLGSRPAPGWLLPRPAHLYQLPVYPNDRSSHVGTLAGVYLTKGLM